MCSGPLRSVLEDCAAGIRIHEAPDIGGIMGAALVSCGQLLPVSCVCHLRELGAVLGQYDADGQMRALQALIERVDVSIAQLRQGRADRCRSYEVLGVCAGCALAIILL